MTTKFVNWIFNIMVACAMLMNAFRSFRDQDPYLENGQLLIAFGLCCILNYLESRLESNDKD